MEYICQSPYFLRFDQTKHYELRYGSYPYEYIYKEDLDEIKTLKNNLLNIEFNEVLDNDIVFISNDIKFPKSIINSKYGLKIKKTNKIEDATKIIINYGYLPKGNVVKKIITGWLLDSRYLLLDSNLKDNDMKFEEVKTYFPYETSQRVMGLVSAIDEELVEIIKRGPSKLTYLDSLLVYMNNSFSTFSEEEIKVLINYLKSKDPKVLKVGFNMLFPPGQVKNLSNCLVDIAQALWEGSEIPQTIRSSANAKYLQLLLDKKLSTFAYGARGHWHYRVDELANRLFTLGILNPEQKQKAFDWYHSISYHYSNGGRYPTMPETYDPNGETETRNTEVEGS